MTADLVTVSASDLAGLGQAMLQHLGAPEASARLVSEHVVTAHLMGLESHGAIRFAQYARDIGTGRIQPDAQPVVLRATPSVVTVDGGSGFGQVTATLATDLAVEKAKAGGIAIAATRRCNHVGRLGAYVERAARAGVVSIAVAAIPRLGHFVVPWGGADGRLGTNPIAYGFPTSGDPIVADFATSVIPEGRIRTARNKGTLLAEGAALDANGDPTRDPAAFYGPPMGSLLPFGGPAGHKGSALALLVELLGATLAGDRAEADDRSVNGFVMVAIADSAFGASSEVHRAADTLVGYVKSSRPAPGRTLVQVPGEPEFTALRTAGPDPVVTLDGETWSQIVGIAESLHLPVPPVA